MTTTNTDRKTVDFLLKQFPCKQFKQENNFLKTTNGLTIVHSPSPLTRSSMMYSGVIFETETNTVVAMGDQSPLIFDPKIHPKRISMVTLRIQNTSIGFIVNMWHWKDKWHVSTSTYTDASNITWHEQDLSAKCLNSVDLKQLNIDYCYTIFIPDYLVHLTTPLLHLGTRNMTTLEQVALDDHQIGLKFPELFYYRTWEELDKYIEDLPLNTPGVTLNNIETGCKYFVRNSKFDEIQKILGNNRDIEYRSIVLNHLGKRPVAEKLFPILTKTFIRLDKPLRDIQKLVYKCYVTRFIKRKKLIIHPEIHTIMQHLHKEFLERRRSGVYIKVTLKSVYDRIWIYSPLTIAKLLRLYRQDKELLFRVMDYNDENLIEYAKMSAKPEQKSRKKLKY